MELLRNRHSIREKAHRFLSDGKKVRLVLTPKGSACTARFMIHAPEHIDAQVDEALHMMQELRVPGIRVEEVAFSEDTRLRKRDEPH